MNIHEAVAALAFSLRPWFGVMLSPTTVIEI